MQLPCGAWVEFERHATHRVFPTHTIHIVRFWASEVDKLAGKPGVHWDETRSWNGPHANPAAKLIEILDGRAAIALQPAPPGKTHLSAEIVAAMSDAPDTHGNLAHPSMVALKAANS